MKTVEISEEDNSICIDDKFDTTDFTFFPQKKQIHIFRSIKDDCFFNTDIIEYKLSVNPIELQMRTLESSHEPPLEYTIRDGVVLESELKKRRTLFPDQTQRLLKEVEWGNAPMLGNYEVNTFILSRHPELLSQDDYRRFLRQSVERLKMGISKLEDLVKKDKSALVIKSSEYGPYIDYGGTDDSTQSNEYWDLPEEKRAETEYGKKIKYLQDFNHSVFNEGSRRYVGILEFEYKNSTEIIKYFENLLETKKFYSGPKAEPIVIKKSNHSMKWIVVIVISIIALSWGIWSAIGTFLLGSIILGLISRNN